MKLVVTLVLFCSLGSAAGAREFVCAGFEAVPVQTGGAAAKTVVRKAPILSQKVVHLLVIFAQFSDEKPGDDSVPEYAADLFDPTLPGSFSHFYNTMSFGQFPVTGTVLPRRYRSARPASAYLANIPGAGGRFDEFVREVLEQVDQDIDFGLFDNDGPDGLPNSGDDDGWVDYIYVNVRSTPWSFLLGGATGISNLGSAKPHTSRDTGHNGAPIQISGGGGAISREGGFGLTVGSMAHEFGHALGLPDLYDLEYDTPAEDSGGIGRWGLMGWGALGWSGGDGPNPFSAWSRERLGWIDVAGGRLVEVVEDAEGLEVADLQAGGTVLKIPLRAGAANEVSYHQEYLLLEQRVRSGSFYNRNLPGEGVLVWHVRPQMKGNNDEVAKGLDLLCADGLYRDEGYPTGREADGRQGGDNLDFWSHEASYRQAHGGNWGDGTDPFDGVRFTRLGVDTNPSTDPQGLLPSASTGLSLSMRRQGAVMAVDLVFPRWSGVISGAAHWMGTVLVDGDVRVAPEGSLVVHAPTHVLFAGTDRLRQGLDPDQIELHLQGDFSINTSSGYFSSQSYSTEEKAIFAARDPGKSWYGILLDSALDKHIVLPEDRYELRHSEHGFVFQGWPSGVQELGLQTKLQLVDAPGLVTAGNDDGQLSPGETFQVEIEVGNWSLDLHRDLGSRLKWSTDLVYPTWQTSEYRQLREARSFTLYAGGRHAVDLPSLTLSPEAPTGEQIQLVVEVCRNVSAGRHSNLTVSVALRDTLTLPVAGHYPAHQIRFEVPGRTVRDLTALIYIDRPSTIRALVQGEVEEVDLVVRSLSTLEALGEVALLPQEEAGIERIFEGIFQPPGAGFYQLIPRVRGRDGATVFSSTDLRATALLAERPAPVVVFLGDQYTAEQKTLLRDLFAEVVGDMGQKAHIFDLPPGEDGRSYDAILAESVEEGGIVFWLGQGLDTAGQAAFRGFLERGGRLCVASRNFRSTPKSAEFMRDMFRVAKTEYQSHGTQVHSPYQSGTIQFGVSGYSWLDIIPPAVPVLFSSSGQATGLALDTGTYRALYFPFDVPPKSAALQPLLEAVLVFLSQRAVEAVALEVPGLEIVGEGLALLPDQAPLARVRVKGTAAAAELVVYKRDGVSLVGRLPMHLVEERAGEQIFETAFQSPGEHLLQYQLFVHLRTAGGASLFNDAALRVVQALPERPVLALIGNQYTAGQKALLERTLTALLAEMGLEANFRHLVDEEDGGYYDAVFSQHLDQGEVVIWLGGSLDVGSQAAFRRFLARGGRLLVASRMFSSRATTELKDFLAEVFYTRAETWGNPTQMRGAGPLAGVPLALTVNHLPLELQPGATPILRDEKGAVAGLLVDSTYKAVYLPFDLRYTDEASIRSLLGATLPLLYQAPERLLLQPPELLPVLGLEPFFPQLVVLNEGRGASAAFRVGYQILLGEEVVATFAQEQPLLEGDSRRVVALPGWTPPGEGVYRIRFGLSATAQGELAYQPATPLRLLNTGAPFESVALEGGVAPGQGAAFFDYDGDGSLDLYLVRPGAADQLWRNEGSGFTERSEEAGLVDQGRGRGLAIGDWDGDGDLDLYLVKEGPNRFLRNEGDGHFADTTGTLADAGAGRSAGFFDADLDGDLDLYLVNAGGANRLYRNQGGWFVESAKAAGLADEGDGRGLAIGDWDGDGDADLFVANASGSSRLYRNEGGQYRDANEVLGQALGGGTTGPVFGDYDGDGDADLFVSSATGLNRLLRNEGEQFFQEVTQREGFYLGEAAVGAAFSDYDNDGDLDLVTTAASGAGGDELYHNLGTHLVPAGDLLALRAHSAGAGVSVADYDGDGSQDLLVAAAGTRLYRNGSGSSHWLRVVLEGPESNPDGLGARVEVVVGQTRHYREVQSAYGSGSQVQPGAHFGLGGVVVVDSLRVQWPDGTETVQEGVAGDQSVRVRHPQGLTSLVAEEAGMLPAVFALLPNYPNPFNAGTSITYRLARGTPVHLAVYNMAGQRVRRLVDTVQGAGQYRVFWDGRDEKGREVGSGVYLYRLVSGEWEQTRRLVLLK